MTTQPGHHPQPTATPAGHATPTNADRAQAARWLAALDELSTERPTSVRIDDPTIPSHKDGTQIGNTPPVAQPDSRIVPKWAVGIAVASLGVGAGSTGLGCAAWLVLKGLSMVSVPGLERFAWIIVAPFAGATMLATAVACLIGKLKKAAPPTINQHYTGNVYQDHRSVENSNRGVWVRNTNELPR